MSNYGFSITDEAVIQKQIHRKKIKEFFDSLQKCTLKKNNLLENAVYDKYDNINELFLHNCYLESFPEDITYILNKVTKLWLSQNKLTKLPSTMHYLKSVRSIWLNQNLFEDIPNLPLNIESLYLHENVHLCNIVKISTYTNLKELYLHECSISEIPDSIQYLTTLIQLDLHGNSICKVNPNLFKLKTLQKLYLHGNNIIEIPKNIKDCLSLWFLTLHYNQLTELPEEFGELEYLQRLSLHHNVLKTLPKSFAKLSTHIKALSLFSNELEDIDDDILRGLTQNCDNIAIYNNKFPPTKDFSILSTIKNVKI